LCISITFGTHEAQKIPIHKSTNVHTYPSSSTQQQREIHVQYSQYFVMLSVQRKRIQKHKWPKQEEYIPTTTVVFSHLPFTEEEEAPFKLKVITVLLKHCPY